MAYKIVLLVVFIISSTLAAPSQEVSEKPDIASMIPICKRTDPNLNDCIKKAAMQLKDKVRDGVPALNFPSFQPLKIPTIKLEQSSETLTYKAVLMDVVFHGLSNYEFTDIDINVENLTVVGTALFNHVYLDAEYMIMGKFQMLPIEGSGRVMANFTDNVAKITMRGALVKRNDGEFYFMNHDTNVSVKIGDAKANFENLYSGSDDKSKITEHIVNMHSDEIFEELQPAVETVLSMLVDDVAGKFFNTIPFNKLFPE